MSLSALGERLSARRKYVWYCPNSPEQERRFYASLRLENGTYKTTTEHRLDTVNTALSAIWKRENYQPKTIVDIGVSSGVSTVEWLDHLNDQGYLVEMTGTDLCLYANLVSLGKYEFLETNSHVLMHALFGIPFRSFFRRLDYVTGRAIATWAINAAAMSVLRREPVPKQVVSLLVEAAKSSRIKWVEESVFEPGVGKFDVVRAANILNRTYFPEERIRAALSNIQVRLSDGGWLIVCRTHSDGSNHGAVYRLGVGNKFSRVAQIGIGSEIDRIVLAS